MAIEFVGAATAGLSGSTSASSTIALNSGLTGGIASSVSAGDIVIAVFGTGATADRTLAITDGTSNYTLIGSELYSDDVFDTNLRVAYKVMGGTPDTATTFGPSGDIADAKAVIVYVFRGVDTTTPLDVAAVTATGNGTSRANPAGITPTTAGAFPVFVGAAAHNGGTDTFTSSDLTSFVTRGANDTNDSTIGIGHIANWSSGESNAAAFGHSQADSADFSWAAVSFVLRPITDTTDDLLANDVTSASSVGTPAIGQTHVLNASDVASASSVGTPVLGQVHALLANDVASASSVGTPAIALVTPLLADDVASASSVSAPVIGQVHALTANDVASASSVSAPALAEAAGGTDALLADSVSSASSVSAPVLTIIASHTAGRSAATSYSYRTLGSIRREKERELAKIARRAQRKVAAAIESEPTLGLQALVESTVEATVPASVTWLTPAMLDSVVKSIVDFHRAQWARIQEQEDEEDAEVLLLVA